MKYLDEQIEIAFEDLTVNKSGTYRYTIENITGNIIFVGNVFITAGEYEIVVNITDIVSNYAYINNSIKNYEANSDRIIEIFTGYLYVDGLVRESSSDYIYLAYRYPHLLKRLELIEGNTQYNILPGLLPVYPTNFTSEYGFSSLITLEGSGTKNVSIIYNDGTNYGIKNSTITHSGRNTFVFADKLSELKNYELPTEQNLVSWTDLDGVRNIGGTYIFPTSTWFYVFGIDALGEIHTLGYVQNNGKLTLTYKIDLTHPTLISFGIENNEGNSMCTENFTANADGYIISFTLLNYGGSERIITSLAVNNIVKKDTIEKGIIVNIENQKTKIGEFCDNLDGYYLQWQDRMGALQSLHFSKGNKFSINYENTSITNYRGEIRNINIQTTHTFEINSGWISEQYYPYYESIFVSPYLKLYDVKEDKVYNVILKDKQYEEKTFRNQGRQLFNLNLKLEENKKQNIIY